MTLGKEMFRILPKESLPRAIARALGNGPFLGEGVGHCPREKHYYSQKLFIKNIFLGLNTKLKKLCRGLNS